VQNLKCKTKSVIGLTGPAGAGKDTVAKILKQHGAYIINVDELAHEIYPLVLDKLIEKFGKGILGQDGAVDRKKLGEIVFGDKKKLWLLDEIMHPKVKTALKSKIQMSKSKQGIVIINAALPQLFEGLVDETWVVMASREIRLNRIKNKKVIDMQFSDDEYRKIADVMIENKGTIEELNAKVQAHLKV